MEQQREQTQNDILIEKDIVKSYKYDSLKQHQIWAYATGHFFNDLCAACWFNYLILYLTQVLEFKEASYSILSGQLFDAIATPLVGYFSDKTNTFMGKRTPWYLFGFILVIISFIPIWANSIFIKIFPPLNDNYSFQLFFYTFFPSIFNVGWAAVQISHMSLVPSLTCSRYRRDILNTRRNTFTFVANLVVLLLALIFSKTINDGKQQFQALGFTCAGIGILTSLFFLFYCREVQLTKECTNYARNLKEILKEREVKNNLELNKESQNKDDSSFQRKQEKGDQCVLDKNGGIADDLMLSEDEELNQNKEILKKTKRAESLSENIIDWKQWFKQVQFYQYGIAYMGTRLFCNVISTMLNFYLIYVIKVIKNDNKSFNLPFQLVLISLLLYNSSVFASFFLNFLYQKIGRKQTFTLGVVLMGVSEVALAFMKADDGFSNYFIYVIAAISGFSQAIQLNTAINLISEVIGLRGAGGAFVFGSYSFLDKISTGIVLFIITESSLFKDGNESFIRWVTVIVPIASSILSWILIMVGKAKDYDDKNKNKNKNQKIARFSLADEFAS
ncbi:major facilitator superfamily protein, putative [Ichthyophthirius multifiliis]|uniref:Major facilitator superfamily protein, putative n=1 Tax=Ichthyophthirius multifiliis TaxID=5932 RepID=G0QQK3_ICHMU|nr:major facilitator superfamily protein, putative [Ichthyophthirius multifiliis]EGR32497.1 major facilitator superfamily protein, putative [Ichthyophthirius multifiliis]|eukprot:XP_004036483.1 major facilitator superfamily protein, putative [Ichthyophthirius multifiliis]